MKLNPKFNIKKISSKTLAENDYCLEYDSWVRMRWVGLEFRKRYAERSYHGHHWFTKSFRYQKCRSTPYNAISGVGFPVHKPYPYSKNIGEDTSILGTF